MRQKGTASKMRFNLNKSIGEWFPFFTSEVGTDGEIKYNEPEKDGGRVQLRIADAETLEKIQAETRTKTAAFVKDKETRQMVRVPYIEQTPEQEKREREMIWDHAIQSWEGILDVNGAPIPCTLENKMKLMNVPVFARFIGKCLTTLSGATAEKKAAVEKN